MHINGKLVLVVLGMATLGAFTLSAQDEKTQWDGVFTEEQAERGAELYVDKCASCHGPQLLGSEMAPGLIGGEFAANWNDLSLGDMFERIRISMPQDDPGSLTRQQNSDVLAYMLLSGQYPAGETELPSRADELRMYKFLSMKPGS